MKSLLGKIFFTHNENANVFVQSKTFYTVERVPRWRRGIVLDLQSGVPGFIPRWRPMPGLYAASIRHLKWQCRENFLTGSIYRWLFIDTEQCDWPSSHDPPVWCVGTAAFTRSGSSEHTKYGADIAQSSALPGGDTKWQHCTSLSGGK